MSVGADAHVRLRKACLVRYATYPHEADVLAKLATWKAKSEAGSVANNGDAPSGLVILEKFNHVTIVYDQAILSGEPTSEEAAVQCRALIEHRPMPVRDRIIGLTSVVQARCRVEEGASASEMATSATDLLTMLTASEYGVVRGGEISPGVELWGRTDDLGWLVMLCADTDGSEHSADWLLLGPLWKHEVAVHKAQRQYDQFRRLHRRLREQRESLQRAISALATVLDRHGTDGTMIDPEAALKQNAATTSARCAMNEMVGRVRRMVTTLEAQLANLQAMRLLLGSGAGLEALEPRRQHIDQMIAQVRAELDYTEPALESAHDICALHRAALLTDQNEIERRENILRERGNRRIALLGLWIGLMQVVSSVWLAEKTSSLWTWLVAIWSVIGIVGVTVWWFGTERTETLVKSQDA